MIRVPVSYRLEWQDGYGARGWKLDAALEDTEVIAATAETGLRLPTSVLVHDILDHHLCGLALGGHRNEAIALHQLARRTGADPRPDLLQMVDEDLLHGGVVGEPLRDFLPTALRDLLPEACLTEREMAGHLMALLGRDNLRQALLEHLQAIGCAADGEAQTRYRQTGLDPDRRGPLGLALQALLAQADGQALAEAWPDAHGEFTLADRSCTLHIDAPHSLYLASTYV